MLNCQGWRAYYDLAMANPEEEGPSSHGSYILGRSGWGTLTLPQHLTGATCCLLAFWVPTYSLDPNGSYLVPQEYCPASSEEFSKGWVWGVTWGLHLYKAVAQGS